MSLRQVINLGIVASLSLICATAMGTPPVEVGGARVVVADLVDNCSGERCDVAVGPALLPGRSRTVHRRQVVVALHRAGFQSDGIRIPKKQRIKRPSQMIQAKQLTKEIRSSIENVIPAGVAIASIGRVNEVEVPTDGYEVIARWPTSIDELDKHASIPIDLIADGHNFRSIQVAVTLQFMAQVPVAKKDLRAGHIIDGSELIWETVQLKTPLHEIAKEPMQIIGHRLAEPIERDKPFKKSILERVPVVYKGDRLTLTSNVGLVHITTRGTARQQGAVGDRILVLAESINRTMWAEIIAPGRAMVSP